MNKTKALSQGLNFTGIYNSDKNKTKNEIASCRKERPGSRIVMVTENPSGYSAYADDLYFAYNIILKNQNIESKYLTTKTILENEYKKDLEKLNKQYQITCEKLNEQYQNTCEKIKEAQEKIKNRKSIN